MTQSKLTNLCESIETTAMVYLDDELATEERRELELHLLDCTGCRQHVEHERTELAAHEYVHVWQYDLGGNACMLGPRWLSEGMAESLAYRSPWNEVSIVSLTPADSHCAVEGA